jgi:serine phosphatase RsbU (regulator of sigma subunit)
MYFDTNDKIIVFTDGLIENRGANEKGQLGRIWLKSVLHKHKKLFGKEFLNQIWTDYRLAIGSTPPDDDTTVVVIERQ